VRSGVVDATVMPEDGAVERLAGISTIEWALGLASPFDVRSARVPVPSQLALVKLSAMPRICGSQATTRVPTSTER